MTKVELVAPAGDLERLKTALMFGADAVYCSTPKFSMRTREIGFNLKSLKDAVEYAHGIGKKIYFTANVFAHANEIDDFLKHLDKLIQLTPDGLIISDSGIVKFVLDNYQIPVHLSTQANTTNQLTCNFYHQLGIKRIVLARELSLKEIKTIIQKSPVEIEVFVHGAMCMAYSGRCQISNYLVGRDPNKGECIQACRFKYQMYGLKEDKRPHDCYEIFEDNRGAYILNSKDLCMIEHLDKLIEAGIKAFKIEGRMKSVYYLATVVRAYRQAIDLYYQNPQTYHQQKKQFFSEITKTFSRGFTTGFYFGKPDENSNNYLSQKESSDWLYVGMAKNYNSDKKMVEVEVKNHLEKGVNLEIVTADKIIKHRLTKFTKKNQLADFANANDIIYFDLKTPVPIGSLIRNRVK